jgi:predicted transcriptional regulator
MPLQTRIQKLGMNSIIYEVNIDFDEASKALN